MTVANRKSKTACHFEMAGQHFRQAQAVAQLPNSTVLSYCKRARPMATTLTAAEAALYLKVKSRTLLLWLRRGKVEAYALSGTRRRVWRFRKTDLDTALMETPVLHSPPLSVRSEERRISCKEHHGFNKVVWFLTRGLEPGIFSG
jgi:excisionase family DNA binding protein